MRSDVPYELFFNIEFRVERSGKTRAPSLQWTIVPDEDVGLESRKAPLASFRPRPLHSIDVLNGWREEFWMMDTPGRTVRPIYPDTVANLAAQKLVARHAKRLRLG